MTRSEVKGGFRRFCLILLMVVAVIIVGCAGKQGESGTLGEAGKIIRQRAEILRPALSGQRLLVSGTLVAVDGNDPMSCSCFFVCDSNGENCTPCMCDPEDCGSCEE